MSLSLLFPTITIGTLKLGERFLAPVLFAVALNLVSRICSRRRITSSKDSLESILKTRRKRSPGKQKVIFISRDIPKEFLRIKFRLFQFYFFIFFYQQTKLFRIDLLAFIRLRDRKMIFGRRMNFQKFPRLIVRHQIRL